jgi:copper chaperone
MLNFTLPQMTCGHCVRAVTEAVHAVDPSAQVSIDLPTHQVQVQTTAARDAVVAQLVEAGYAPA